MSQKSSRYVLTNPLSLTNETALHTVGAQGIAPLRKIVVQIDEKRCIFKNLWSNGKDNSSAIAQRADTAALYCVSQID
ncbi:hypothetical protein HW132_29310 [Brasilonema sp. CT11]|nr:hypothetical protein [Brasilonema sp. CT11]